MGLREFPTEGKSDGAKDMREAKISGISLDTISSGEALPSRINNDINIKTMGHRLR